jgi:hypothetical protein
MHFFFLDIYTTWPAQLIHLDWSIESYLMRSTSHESNCLRSPINYVLPLMPKYRSKHLILGNPLMLETNFYTKKKQRAKL